MNEEKERMIGTDAVTVATYNAGARAYQEHYNAMGPRIADIDIAFSFCSVEKPSVLEIGPGNGREASELVSRVGQYVGVDVSSSMLELARENVPEGEFVEADVVSYDFPVNIDIVFSFASLLHLNKSQMRLVLSKISKSLSEDGIAYISLKRREEYTETEETDAHGTRKFCYYSRDDFLELVPFELNEVYYDEQRHGKDDWFTIVLRKVSD